MAARCGTGVKSVWRAWSVATGVASVKSTSARSNPAWIATTASRLAMTKWLNDPLRERCGKCFPICRNDAALGDQTRHQSCRCHVEARIARLAAARRDLDDCDAPVVGTPRQMRDLALAALFNRDFLDAVR